MNYLHSLFTVYVCKTYQAHFAESFLGFTGVTGDGWYEGVMIRGCRSFGAPSARAQNPRIPNSTVPNSRVSNFKLPQF